MSDAPYGSILTDRPMPEPPRYPPSPPYGDVPTPPAPPLPPAPPFGDGPALPPPAEPPAPKRSRVLLRGLAILGLSGLIGFAVGAIVVRDSSSPTATTTRTTPTTAPRSTQPVPAPGTGSTSSSGSASGTLDKNAIVAAVDPGVVDINTVVDGGQAAGTGIVLTSDGLVLTNNHVIEGATEINVQIAGTGPTHRAHVLGYSVSNDIALIQIDDISGLAVAPIGDSSTVKSGDAVVAIGNALGKSGPHAVTTGKVTALNQTITAGDLGQDGGERLNGLMQIDALLQPGDSGGPLVNENGQVIGINTAASIRSRRSPSSTTGYSIPINTALDIAKRIQNGQSSATVHVGDRGILGVQAQDAGTSSDGVVVAGVQSGSPADGAGLGAGDVITAIDGHAVNSLAELQTALDQHAPGDRVDVAWTDQSGQSHTATVTLVAGPPA